MRVVAYRRDGVAKAEPLYRLVTTIRDPDQAPAREVAALYHERWEIETALDELKTPLRGARIGLRSKTPDLVRREFYGLILAHFAVRGLRHEAAVQAGEEPDRLSFLLPCAACAVIPAFAGRPPSPPFPPRQRAAFHDAVVAEILQERVVSSRNRRTPRGVKRKMSNFPIPHKTDRPLPAINIAETIQIAK
ncbi:MAG: transposase [Stellaceae bacterium]